MMKKVLNWIVNHGKITLGIATFLVTAIVIGSVMLGSQAAYKAYEKQYNDTDLEVRSVSSPAPTRIEFQDDFVSYSAGGATKANKSGRKKKYTAWAEELIVTTQQQSKLVEGDSYLDTYVPSIAAGGSVSMEVTLVEKSFVDIAFVISSEKENAASGSEPSYIGVKDILSRVDFVVNGEIMSDVVDLINEDNEGPEWHTLVMAGFALPKGAIKIDIKSKGEKANDEANQCMPQVRNISVFANAALEAPETEE